MRVCACGMSDCVHERVCTGIPAYAQFRLLEKGVKNLVRLGAGSKNMKNKRIIDIKNGMPAVGSSVGRMKAEQFELQDKLIVRIETLERVLEALEKKTPPIAAVYDVIDEVAPQLLLSIASHSGNNEELDSLFVGGQRHSSSVGGCGSWHECIDDLGAGPRGAAGLTPSWTLWLNGKQKVSRPRVGKQIILWIVCLCACA